MIGFLINMLAVLFNVSIGAAYGFETVTIVCIAVNATAGIMFLMWDLF